MNWDATGKWIIDLVRAFRGGPGRFYAYTFGAGVTLVIGATWLTQFAETVATYVVSSIADYLEIEPPESDDSISPWFSAISGTIMCLLSILGFDKAISSGHDKNQSSDTIDRFSDFCKALQNRRVGFGDEFGGEISIGRFAVNKNYTPRRIFGTGTLAILIVPESASREPPLRVDLGRLRPANALLKRLAAWTDPISKFKGYEQNYYPSKMRRWNQNGLLLYSANSSRDKSHPFSGYYVQIDDHGYVEAVDGRLLNGSLHSKILPADAVELLILGIVNCALELLRTVGAKGCVWVSVSILSDLRYVKLGYGIEDFEVGSTIGKQHRLSLTPVILEPNWDQSSVVEGLRPLFDGLARAGGFEQSPNM